MSQSPLPPVTGLSSAEMVSELSRRGVIPGCRCGKWPAYYGFWDRDGYTLRCRGCLKAIARCTCG